MATQEDVETVNAIIEVLKETKGFGILGTGALIFWKMRKSIGKSTTEYVDRFKKELIDSNKDQMELLKENIENKVSKSLEDQLLIVKQLIDSNQEMNKKILHAINSSMSALNMHTEELVLVIKRQGWAEDSIEKIKKALGKANISVENLSRIEGV
tara:strand:+ start:75 stop:539 length:465 start_codon:yes stop_codon:yes gene_type:complete